MSGAAAPASPEVRESGFGRVEKPWGYELRWSVTDRYAGKLIHVNHGEALSLQYHERKDESIFIVSGELDLLLEDEAGNLVTHRMTPGMSARVLPHRKHRFQAVTDVDLIEASSPELDDVIRLEDKYGRQGTTTA